MRSEGNLTRADRGDAARRPRRSASAAGGPRRHSHGLCRDGASRWQAVPDAQVERGGQGPEHLVSRSKTRPTSGPIRSPSSYGEIATIEDVTLVNSYQGIIDPVGSTFVIRNVCGTPLVHGHANRQLLRHRADREPGVQPRRLEPLGSAGPGRRWARTRPWMLAHGTAIRFFRIDWQCAAFVHIDGYKTGVEMLASKAGPILWPFLRIGRSPIARTPFRPSTARFPGFLFTHCLLDGDDAAVVTCGRVRFLPGLPLLYAPRREQGGRSAREAGLGGPLPAMCTSQGEVAHATG